MTILNNLLTQQRFFKLELINNNIIAHVLVLHVMESSNDYTFKISAGQIHFEVDPRLVNLNEAIHIFKNHTIDTDLAVNDIASFYNRKMAARFILTFYPSIKIEDQLLQIYEKYD